MNKELNPLTYLVLSKFEEPKSNLGGTSGSASDINLLQLDSVTSNTPQGQNMQASYEDAKKGGWVGTAADYAKEYSQTQQGRETLNWVGSLLAPMLGNQQVPQMSNAGVAAKNKNTGLSPTSIVLIALASVAVLAGIGIAIYKYSK